jgi:hypothetical protein
LPFDRVGRSEKQSQKPESTAGLGGAMPKIGKLAQPGIFF